MSSRKPPPLRPGRRDALARVLAAERALDRRAALARDPVRFARAFTEREDREVAALLCALLAFGRVETIGAKLEELFARLEGAPGRASRSWPEARVEAALAGFVHRTFRGAVLARLLVGAGRVARAHGGLYAPLEGFVREDGALRPALARWVALLRTASFGARLGREERHLLPSPEGASACKRLLLLCRWLARPDDGVDLGLVALPPRLLVVPLDVHVHRVARALGFTARASASWAAAEEVTAALRALDANDPVRFDFALCHTEIAARVARSPRR